MRKYIRLIAVTALLAAAGSAIASSAAHAQAAVVARVIMGSRSAVAITTRGYAPANEAAIGNAIRSFQKESKISPFAPGAAGAGLFGAANDNFVSTRAFAGDLSGAITESDVKEFCEKRSGAGFEHAYSRLNRALKSNASLLVRRDFVVHGSDDLAQDVIVKLLLACERILAGEHPNIAGYVHEALKNRTIDVFRSMESDPLWLSSSLPTSYAGLSFNPMSVLEARDQLRKLSQNLTAREQQVVTLTALGYSTSEAAKQMKVSDDRVRQIREQVRLKLTSPE